MVDPTSPGGWRAQFLLLAAIWGSSFLFIKVLGERWPPLWVALGRVGLGAITLIAITFARRERLKLHGRTWLHLLVAAMLANAIPFTLFAYGEQHVSSVVAGLWNATTPLWVLSAAVFVFGEERLSRDRVLGLLTGFAGVLLVLGPWHGLGHGGARRTPRVCRRRVVLRPRLAVHPAVPAPAQRQRDRARRGTAAVRDRDPCARRSAGQRSRRPRRWESTASAACCRSACSVAASPTR